MKSLKDALGAEVLMICWDCKVQFEDSDYQYCPYCGEELEERWKCNPDFNSGD